jgi:outer membrane protein assembly factor BamA
VRGYAVAPGDRADSDALTAADRDLEETLKKAGWYSAQVGHRLGNGVESVALVVDVKAGPFVRVRFQGNRHFDEGELTDHLELETTDDRSAATIASRVEKFYVERGFLDVRVTPELRGSPSESINDLVLHVRENDLVRVVAREYPCLSGPRSADEVGAEIDSFLSEALPGTGFVGAVDPRAVDQTLGPHNTTGARVPPVQANPWKTYVTDVYERATRHLTELYRSEGYLSATVGPVVLMRRACDRHSPPGQCIPIGERVRPPVRCPKTETELPTEDAAPTAPCVPDPRTGRRCEPEVVLHIPIKLGPRAELWDAAFEGNKLLTERELADIAELPFGEPVSQIELEKARRCLFDEYAERGFAFATVELRLEFSPDRTRTRALFVINEREPVRVKDIIVRGAQNTNESLILGRVALEKGDLYRRSDVRKTEERLATLGVFSSVQVGLEDPEVFAKEKVVVISVRERPQQYLDVRPGFSTGDGFRITFEYGHRNLGGQAIRLTLRVQLGLLPDFLIFEPEVRYRFQQLPLTQRLERRNTASLEFPEIGLGPLFPLGVDGIDLRDNARDFGLTKEAGILTLSYRPTTRFVTQLGGSLELNDSHIFAQGQNLVDYVRQNPNLRVPDGKTYVVAERTGVTWDRRDDPFNATRGTFVSAVVEHVHAAPADLSTTITSDFLRLTNRIGGYIRLSQRGLSLAMSFRWGYNIQLIPNSQTYPDRLFYFGGVDSIRGFIQDSVIPQDLAERIQSDQQLVGQPGVDQTGLLTPDRVAIRGGNVMINPRAELRIPLGGVFQTAIFLDSGNLWLDPTQFDPTHLRYAAGTGLRATTPVGPLALDVGYNLDRRYWEDPFAFHFSIGLF